MTKNLYLLQPRYVAALKRQLARVEAGVALSASDCDTPGIKSTDCSWGLCSHEIDAWPDAQDHLWPEQFVKADRVAPLYRRKHQKCPLDRRELASEDPNGCFYSCRVFSPNKGDLAVRRIDVVTLYQRRIAEVENLV